MPYFTYILRSKKDQGFYFGQTQNLDERIRKHNAGKVKSTKARKPFTLHYKEEFITRSEAYQREQFFKSLEGRNWLKSNKIID
ncbi:GIY-YIG nuclease family protein [Jiulongibacter sediminis]|uniref:Endonuclease n=1 Tax=Jiulongibacter sediminis TaxID=1605367 RepID=A0A0N8H9C3_9BACT|nr:GIY-YIG nuclease family protein [Jiulongibacter sediminis]KPM46972.1 endonuclease [Jiulongibacter sediminis]TBX22318.1 endonuclease [Jiulongibacter sediminis]